MDLIKYLVITLALMAPGIMMICFGFALIPVASQTLAYIKVILEVSLLKCFGALLLLTFESILSSLFMVIGALVLGLVMEGR